MVVVSARCSDAPAASTLNLPRLVALLVHPVSGPCRPQHLLPSHRCAGAATHGRWRPLKVASGWQAARRGSRHHRGPRDSSLWFPLGCFSASRRLLELATSCTGFRVQPYRAAAAPGAEPKTRSSSRASRLRSPWHVAMYMQRVDPAGPCLPPGRPAGQVRGAPLAGRRRARSGVPRRPPRRVAQLAQLRFPYSEEDAHTQSWRACCWACIWRGACSGGELAGGQAGRAGGQRVPSGSSHRPPSLALHVGWGEYGSCCGAPLFGLLQAAVAAWWRRRRYAPAARRPPRCAAPLRGWHCFLECCPRTATTNTAPRQQESCLQASAAAGRAQRRVKRSPASHTSMAGDGKIPVTVGARVWCASGCGGRHRPAPPARAQNRLITHRPPAACAGHHGLSGRR